MFAAASRASGPRARVIGSRVPSFDQTLLLVGLAAEAQTRQAAREEEHMQTVVDFFAAYWWVVILVVVAVVVAVARARKGRS